MAVDQHDAALRWLDSGIAAEFVALADDRRGDVLLAKGQADDARQAYRKAWDAMDATSDYRRLVEAKLNALGVNPSAPKTEKTQ
jgi:predicted negative regulator of RcsB-dependent stress response